MKPAGHIKPYRDQTLFRDLGFLLLATGFLLYKVFDQPLQDAMLYAPLIVFGIFAVLIGGAHLLIGVISLLDAIGHRLGMSRGPR